MRVYGNDDALLLGVLLLIFLAAVFLGAAAARAAPLTSSQVITLEHGPDGLWLSQAWVIEWQVRPDVRLAAIYDTWRGSSDGVGWTSPHRQMDMSATWGPEGWGKRPLALTVGRRWRLEGDGGPWVYGMVALGW